MKNSVRWTISKVTVNVELENYNLFSDTAKFNNYIKEL
jgi:hypothetical protein